MASGAATALTLAGRVGHGDFINGIYELENQVINGKPVYKSTHTMPEDFDSVAGMPLLLYYHQENDAWVISHEPKSLDVVAYAPSHIKNTWHISTGPGPYTPDPSVKLISGDGDVLTNLSAWTSAADGEVALKMVKEGPGSERPETIFEMIRGVAQRYPDVPALAAMKPDGQWGVKSYRQLFDEANTVAKAFVKLGLEERGGVLIMGSNSPEWVISHVAGVFAGGLSCGVPPASFTDEIRFIGQHAKANIVVAETTDQVQRILEAQADLPHLKAIVQYKGYPDGGSELVHAWADLLSMGRDVPDGSNEGQQLQARQEGFRANTPAIIGLTAGTSQGNPKLALLSHDNITWHSRALAEGLGLQPAQDQVASYLPLNHMMSQMLELWVPLAGAASIWFGRPNDCLEPKILTDFLKAVRPTIFYGTPHIFSIFSRKIAEEKKISKSTIKKGLKGSLRQQSGKTQKSAGQFTKLQKAVGLDRCRVALCGSAPLSREVLDFFLGISIPIYETYGLTETTGPHTICLPGNTKNGTTGKPVLGCQVRLTHGMHEIIAFGRNVCMGYLQEPSLSAEIIDERGWLHTGDMGAAGRDMFLQFGGRICDLVKTAGGEAIVTFGVENKLKDELPFVSNALVIGDKRKYLVVLFTLKVEMDADGRPTDRLTAEARESIKALGAQALSVPDVLQEPTGKVNSKIQQVIDECNETGKANHKIEKFAILPREFTIDGGELDSLHRLRRRTVIAKYQRQIDQLYGGSLDDYENAPWYHGPVDRKVVEALLKRDNGGQDGWFLIRKSNKEKNTFVVSLSVKKKLYHNQVKYANGLFATHEKQGDHQYESLQQLVDHHKEAANGFQTRLTVHCQK
eukprot:m.486986 g.486986  ORF g.486986 m.486986 type:complete len:856 (+) comp24725_c0_seq1:265-2832(+)